MAILVLIRLADLLVWMGITLLICGGSAIEAEGEHAKGTASHLVPVKCAALKLCSD
jgi:hypothetical protein